jgi:phosphomannomutase
VGVVDERGEVIWGDMLLLLAARDVLKRHPGATIICEVKCSQTLVDDVERNGGRCIMWKTGHSPIKKKLKEEGALLAGEMSGHIFFAHRYYGYDDAMYAGVRLLAVLGRGDESLAELRDRLPAMINTPEVRFPCDEERKFQVIEEVRERLKDMDGITVHDIDGVRVQSDDGWWLLRASNTQAVLVARCEAASEEGLKRLKGALAGQLRASGLETPDLA